MTTIDWDDVRYLLAVGKHGTLERAARTLKTNATTVGRRLSQLEEKLGVRLFDRSSKGLVMTETARRILPHAEQMERDAFALARLAASGDQRHHGQVHVTSTEAIATRFLMPHLPALRERHPGIDLLLSCTDRRLDLGKREADIALRLRRPEEPDVVAKKLFSVELALYASTGYLARRGRPDEHDGSSWAEHDLVGFGEARSSRPENEWLARACPGARVVLRSNSVSALLDATLVGLGIGLLPTIAADREPDLVRLATHEPPAPRHVWLTYHRDSEPNTRTRAVVDFLIEVLSSPPRLTRPRPAAPAFLQPRPARFAAVETSPRPQVPLRGRRVPAALEDTMLRPARSRPRARDEGRRADAASLEIALTTTDGTPLSATRFEPEGEAVGQIVIHGATAVPQRHYAPFASFLAGRGYRVLTYDYRGVARSAPADLRSCRATMSDWLLDDAPTAVRALTEASPGLPLFAVGHSFGGQIAAGLAGAPAPKAVVTAGSQRGYWATFPEGQRWLVALRLFALLPATATAFGYVPGKLGLGEDMPRGVLLEWARWCRDPKYLYGDHPQVKEALARYPGRLLALSVTDDDFAPRHNVEWLLDRYRRATVEHLRFEPGEVGAKKFGHFGFFRRSVGGSLWPSIAGFFDEARGAAPRPADVRRGAPRPTRPPEEELMLLI